MPFPACSFDAVINIESSHCYPSMDRFLAEVHRVLRPGGSFLFADLRSHDGLDALNRQFEASRMDLEREDDITANVLTALRVDNDRKAQLIQTLIPWPFRRPFAAFAGIEGHHELRRVRKRQAAVRQCAPHEAEIVLNEV